MSTEAQNLWLELSEAKEQLEAMQAEIERLREEITDLWHQSSSDKPLEDHLGMTGHQYSEWVMGASLSKDKL